MIKLTIAILLILSTTPKNCGDGCLRCEKPQSENAVSQCVFCDTFSNYILREGACQKHSDLECVNLAQNGQCLRCNQNHYIDLATSKCLQIDNNKRVDKCLYYNDNQECMQCNGPFYLINNRCIAVQQQIPNCEIYNEKFQCQLCEKGYYFDQVIQMCIALNGSPECISHSRFICYQCEKGYSLDPNYYFESKFLFQSFIDNTYIYNILRNNKLGYPSVNNDVLQCRPTQITNCKQTKSFNQCNTCNDGYYLLSNGTCKAYPNQPIPYCNKYTSLTVCQECVQGAIMTGLGKCRLILDREFIPNCNTYSTTARIPLCVSCSPEYFVFDNKCVKRLNVTIDNCLTFDLNADKCAACNTGMLLSNDGLLCLMLIDNCQEYQPFDQQTKQEQLICIKCKAEHYLENNVCLNGSQANCNLYQTSANICVECNERYYGAPDCKEHGDLPQCKSYSKVQLNVCDECTFDHRTFRYIEKCINLPPIDNCKTYASNVNSTSNTCQECVDKFTLTTNNTCEQIDVNLCIEATWVDNGQDTCTKCDLNYGLATDNTNNAKSCEQPHHYLTYYCDKMNQSQNNFNNFECEVCKVDTIPFNFGNHHVCIEDSKLQFLASAVTLIDNCAMYESTTLCQRCAQGFYLASNKASCVSQCVDNNGKKIPFSTIKRVKTNNVISTIQNQCKSAQADNQLIYGVNLKEDNSIEEEIIIGCQGNFVKEYFNFSTANIDHSNVNPNNIQTQNWIDHFKDIYPEVRCPAQPANYTLNGVANGNLINDCEAYIKYTATSWGCLKCKFGYTGKITASASGFIEECIPMPNCSQNKFKNIIPYWEQLFSCHQCAESNQIPVIGYVGQNTNKTLILTSAPFKKFTFQNSDDYTTIPNADTVISPHIFCANVSTEAEIRTKFNVEYIDANYGKVVPLENCALAAFDLNYADAFDNSNAVGDIASQDKRALFCAVCKPGYKPSYVTPAMKTCTRIDNCQENSEWFGSCSQCYNGFRYEYKNNKIDFESCVRIPFDEPGLDHCYAYQRLNPSVENDLSGVCVVCEKGYHLNKDNFCEQITVPSCEVKYFQSPNEFRDHVNNYPFAVYILQSGNGCNNCVQGHQAIPTTMLSINNYCVESTYIKSQRQSFPVQTTMNVNGDYNASNFIDHCVQYKARSTTECFKCAENFVLRNDGKACVSNSLFPNCILFDSTGFNCVKCKSGFGLVTGVITGCIKNTIENCKQINEEIAHDKVTCLQCMDGFYPKDNQCLKGSIPNCQVYQSENICKQCEAEYWPFGMLTASNTYVTSTTYSCIKRFTNSNCKVPNFSNNLGDLRCTTCDFPYQKIVNNQHGSNLQENQEIDLSLCLEFGKIENCEKYDKNLILTKQIFTCAKCTQQSYLSSDGLKCLPRQNFFDACAEYDLNQDLCVKCKDNFVLNTDKKSCLTYPQGITNCSKYEENENNGFKCVKCSNQTYLQDNKCVEVPLSQQVQNCAFYLSPSECMECSTGYILENKLCVKIDLIDCQIPLSSKECKVCNKGFRLFSDDGLNKCISLDKKNCLQFQQDSYNKCLLCKTHYYPDGNGDCQIVQNIIQNCIYYLSEKQCQQCQPEYALKWDRTSCISKEDFDNKCSYSMHSAVPQCNVCQAGYHLRNGRCVKFKDDIQIGCFYYNKLSDKCQFCGVQYHMNEDGKCELNSDQIINAQTGDNGDTDNNNDQSFVQKLSILITALIFVMVN